MTLHVLTPDERERERLRTVETVARFTLFAQTLELRHSPTDGYHLHGPAMTVLFGTHPSDIWIASHPIHGTDDQDAVELARREVLTLAKRAHERLVESLSGETVESADPMLPRAVDTEFEAYCAGVV